MEVALQREATVRLEVPSLPMASDTVQACSYNRVGADKLNAISPHQKAVLSSRVAEIHPFLGAMLLNPIHAEQKGHEKGHQDQPATTTADLLPRYEATTE